MDKTYIYKATFTEHIVKQLLEKSDFYVEINNKNSNDIDLKVDGALIDVQYSFNYNKYGDVRIDLLSAFDWLNKDGKREFENDMKKNISLRHLVNKHIKEENKKLGKFLDKKNKMLGVIYLFYNDEMPKEFEYFKKRKISKVVYIPKKIILRELKNNWEIHKKNYKINDKKNLKENHNSSFVAISVEKLIHKYNIPIVNNRFEFDKILKPYLKKDIKNEKFLKLNL